MASTCKDQSKEQPVLARLGEDKNRADVFACPVDFLDQRLKLSLLRAVDAVGVNGTLLKASAALGISQPALTKNLQELEDVLQVRLFYRHSRGMSPTPAGKVFIQAAQRILADVHRLEEDLDQHTNPRGGAVAVGLCPWQQREYCLGYWPGLKQNTRTSKFSSNKGAPPNCFPCLRRVNSISSSAVYTSRSCRTVSSERRFGPNRFR